MHSTVKLSALSLCAFVISIFPALVQAQSDWLNLSWGMSYQEVVERQPDARAATDKHNRQGLFYDVFARMENVVLADVPFRADLLFDSEIRLTGVVMKAYGPTSSLSAGYTRLVQELTDRHGRPMVNQSIPNHPGNYSWNTEVTEIRLSFTEMVRGETDIVLAYYQTAIIERQPIVVVRQDTVIARQDTVVEPPPITSMTITMPVPTPPTAQLTESDQATVSTKPLGFGEFSVQASSDLEHKGFKTIGFGFGGYSYDPVQDFIKVYINGFYTRGKVEVSEPIIDYNDRVDAKAVTNSFGSRVGFGIPQTQVVLFGMIEFFSTKFDVHSRDFNMSGETDGYEKSFGGGIKVFPEPYKGAVSFGIEYSELRRLGVSLGITFGNQDR